jgi:hypothetical protein
MTTNARRTQDSIELPSDARRLGVDGEGDIHYYSRYHGRLWVNVHAETTLVADIDALGDWVSYIDARHGWQECNYEGDSRGLVGTLAERVEVRD